MKNFNDKPSSAGFRMPTDTAQKNGQVVNPPRMEQMGGFSSLNKGPNRNAMKIVPPNRGPIKG